MANIPRRIKGENIWDKFSLSDVDPKILTAMRSNGINPRIYFERKWQVDQIPPEREVRILGDSYQHQRLNLDSHFRDTTITADDIETPPISGGGGGGSGDSSSTILATLMGIYIIIFVIILFFIRQFGINYQYFFTNVLKWVYAQFEFFKMVDIFDSRDILFGRYLNDIELTNGMTFVGLFFGFIASVISLIITRKDPTFTWPLKIAVSLAATLAGLFAFLCIFWLWLKIYTILIIIAAFVAAIIIMAIAFKN